MVQQVRSCTALSEGRRSSVPSTTSDGSQMPVTPRYLTLIAGPLRNTHTKHQNQKLECLSKRPTTQNMPKQSNMRRKHH